MLGQSLVDPLSLRYLQPLQNSNFKFKQCLKPTDEGYSEIKGTLFAIFKIIRQKERHYGILLKSKSEELIYLFYYYRLVERKTSDDHYRKMKKFGKSLITSISIMSRRLLLNNCPSSWGTVRRIL
ncbi:protein of unknown function [Streptococcus thermophilus]|nr:protein of unknown function [Streptococcus thermophilus]